MHIKGIIWRLKCTNGLRAPENQGAFSFRHVGDTQRLRAGISEAIPSALVAARGTMNLWKQAVTTMVENVAAEVEALRELTNIERESVVQRLKAKAGMPVLPQKLPVYDFVNALTASAHDVVPARRLEIETIAGHASAGLKVIQLAGRKLIHPGRCLLRLLRLFWQGLVVGCRRSFVGA